MTVDLIIVPKISTSNNIFFILSPCFEYLNVSTINIFNHITDSVNDFMVAFKTCGIVTIYV